MTPAAVHPPVAAVRPAVRRALEVALTPIADLTSGPLPAAARATASIVARGPGVLAGRRCAHDAFCTVAPLRAAAWRGAS